MLNITCYKWVTFAKIYLKVYFGQLTKFFLVWCVRSNGIPGAKLQTEKLKKRGLCLNHAAVDILVKKYSLNRTHQQLHNCSEVEEKEKVKNEKKSKGKTTCSL